MNGDLLRQLMATGAAAALSALALPAVAQTGTPRFLDTGDSGAFGIQTQAVPWLAKDGTPTQRGKSVTETLRGNGTRAGYTLSHGGIIPDSVRVTVGFRTLRPGEGFYVDPVGGSLMLAEAASAFDTIRISYQYVEGQDANRAVSGGMPGIALGFGNGGALSFGYGMSAGPGGMDFTTYGLGFSNPLGGGSLLNGLVYFSSPAANRSNLVGDSRAALDASAASAQKANPADAKSDHLITQNLTLKSGAASFRATYQDVGAHFNGFQAMKQASAKDAAALAQLATLEKEKGIKRLGFGGALQLTKTGSVGLDWDQIGDGKGSILRQSFGYTSNAFHIKVSQQSVGEKFAAFQGLREADAAQWAHEKGIHRQDLSLGFAAGKGSAFNFDQSTFGDKTGALRQQAFGFTGKDFAFSMSNRHADEKFARLGDLSDAEKANLALGIHKQFNMGAEAKEVTAKDKAQIADEAGLSRNQMALSGKLGKQSSLAFNEFSIADGQGKIQRQTLNFAGKGFSFNYLDQMISEKFTRLGTMSDFEKSQFGNEHGVHRTALGLNLALGKASAFTFSQLSLSDSSGGRSTRSFGLTAKGLELKYDTADTTKAFARSADLAGFSAADKAAMEAERGFRRSDLTLNFTGVKGLNLFAYDYAARDAADNRAKGQHKYNLGWLLNKTTQFTYLSEGNDNTLDGKVQDGRDHALLTLNTQLSKGIKFNMLRDTLSTTTAGATAPTVTTELYHVETDRTKGANLLAEAKMVDLGAGKFENTQQLDLNYRLNKGMSLRLNRLGIDRGKDPSSDTDLVEWKWQLNKGLNFAGTYATTGTNNQTDSSSKAVALTGAIAKNLNLTGTYTEVQQQSGQTSNTKAVMDVSMSLAKPTDVLFIKGFTFAGHYASLTDKHKQQTEMSSAKAAGTIAKNAIGLEYGNSLAADGKAAIARTLTFVSDPNPKRPLHVNILYRARNINRADVQLVRKYDASLRLTPKCTVAYNYVSLPEDAAGNMQQNKTSAFTLKEALNSTMNMAVDYTTAKQMAQKTETSKLGALIDGKVDKTTTVQVGYSVDLATTSSTRTDYHTLKLGLDCQMDGDHYVTVSTEYRMNRDDKPDDMQASVEFKTRF